MKEYWDLVTEKGLKGLSELDQPEEDILKQLLHDRFIHLETAVQGISGDQKDILFELVLLGFDSLTPYKPAVQRIYNELPFQPKLLWDLQGSACYYAQRLLNQIPLTAWPIGNGLRPAALIGLWLYLLPTWLKDDSVDAAPVMADLDKALQTFSRAQDFLSKIIAR